MRLPFRRFLPRRKQPEIKPHMTVEELKAAGVTIDLPSEAVAANPERLRYGKAPEQWTPDPEWAERSGFAAWQRKQEAAQQTESQDEGDAVRRAEPTKAEGHVTMNYWRSEGVLVRGPEKYGGPAQAWQTDQLEQPLVGLQRVH